MGEPEHSSPALRARRLKGLHASLEHQDLLINALDAADQLVAGEGEYVAELLGAGLEEVVHVDKTVLPVSVAEVGADPVHEAGIGFLEFLLEFRRRTDGARHQVEDLGAPALRAHHDLARELAESGKDDAVAADDRVVDASLARSE